MTSKLSQHFARFIREKRNAMGLSQVQFSNLIYGNVNRRTYIAELETNRREVSAITMNLMLEKTNSWIEFIEQ